MNKKLAVTIAVMVLMLNTLPAYAYLDPGTGSAILQGILGALAAIIVVAKLYWHRILRFLGISKKPVEKSVESKQDENKKDE